MALVPENKPYAHHKSHLHTMKVYKTRPVSLAIEVFPIKIVFFFRPLKQSLIPKESTLSSANPFQKLSSTCDFYFMEMKCCKYSA